MIWERRRRKARDHWARGHPEVPLSYALGVGRFAKIGIPAPELLAPFVGAVEIVCGGLLLLGLGTRLAAVPLLIDISVAIATTKLPMLAKQGFWAMPHEARMDYTMFLGLLYLLVAGGRAVGGRCLPERIESAAP